MALRVALSSLISDLRAETNRSLMVALGAGERDHLVYLLRRTQEWLSVEYLWPHLIVDRDITVGAGQRYVAYPADMTFEAVQHVHVHQGSIWTPVRSGIGPAEYTALDSDAGVTSTPIRHWQHRPDTNTIEVWPVPSQTQTIRLHGRKTLRPLVDDADTCDIDSTAIVLHAAATLLARSKAEDAQMALQQAQRYVRSLIARGSNKGGMIVIGGGVDQGPRPRPGIEYIP